MIDESGPWRDDLLRIAPVLERRLASPRRWTLRTHYLVERDLLFSAFALRKLEDSHKLATSYARHQIQAREYPLRADVRPPDYTDRWSPERFYDEPGAKRVLALSRLADYLIHSHFLLFGEDAIWVNSDRTSKASLFEFPVVQWTAALRRYGTEDIVEHTEWHPGNRRSAELRVSNHDMVERGVARYVDPTTGEIEYVAPLDPEQPWRMFASRAYPLESDRSSFS